ASDVEEVPARKIDSFGPVGCVKLPGVMASAIPGFRTGAQSADTSSRGNGSTNTHCVSDHSKTGEFASRIDCDRSGSSRVGAFQVQSAAIDGCSSTIGVHSEEAQGSASHFGEPAIGPCDCPGKNRR